jgi:hypothetical protein
MFGVRYSGFDVRGSTFEVRGSRFDTTPSPAVSDVPRRAGRTTDLEATAPARTSTWHPNLDGGTRNPEPNVEQGTRNRTSNRNTNRAVRTEKSERLVSFRCPRF